MKKKWNKFLSTMLLSMMLTLAGGDGLPLRAESPSPATNRITAMPLMRLCVRMFVPMVFADYNTCYFISIRSARWSDAVTQSKNVISAGYATVSDYEHLFSCRQRLQQYGGNSANHL